MTAYLKLFEIGGTRVTRHVQLFIHLSTILDNSRLVLGDQVMSGKPQVVLSTEAEIDRQDNLCDNHQWEEINQNNSDCRLSVIFFKSDYNIL